MKQWFRFAAALLCAAAVLCAPVSALSARSAVVMDARTGQLLYARDENRQSLIASTTKIMTGLLICEAGDLEREVVIPPEAAGIEGSSLYLQPGERLRVLDLLYGMMLRSGNDCACALAIAHSGSVEAFVRRMNGRAAELGLAETHFANPHGLDNEGNYSTAVDLARLACAAMENETFAEVVRTKSHRFGERVVMNHNKLLWRCEGVDGVKTGFTRAAGRILVSSAVRQGRRLICVTIHAPDDWNDHSALLDTCYAMFEYVPLCKQGDVLGRFSNGAPAVSACDVQALLLPEERIDEIRVNIGPESGTAEFLCAGKLVAACPLAAADGGETWKSGSRES